MSGRCTGGGQAGRQARAEEEGIPVPGQLRGATHQPSYTQGYGRSPECVNLWRASVRGSEKALSQPPSAHCDAEERSACGAGGRGAWEGLRGPLTLKGRSPVCVRVCACLTRGRRGGNRKRTLPAGHLPRPPAAHAPGAGGGSQMRPHSPPLDTRTPALPCAAEGQRVSTRLLTLEAMGHSQM